LEIIASMHQQLAEQTNTLQEAMEHLQQSHVAEQIIMHHEYSKLEVEAAEVMTLSKQLQSSDLRLEMEARQMKVLRVQLQPMQAQLNELSSLIIISGESLDHKSAWSVWQNSISGVPSHNKRSPGCV